MKYKVGDEVLVKVQIVEDSVFVYGLKTPDGILFTAKKDGVIPAPDMTAEEAWEIAKKIFLRPPYGGFNATELKEIFRNTDLLELTPQQAKAKIEAWEAEKEIKVGDVVTITNNDPTSITNGKTVHTGVITSAHPDDYYDLILGDGLTWSYVDGEKLKKTGRHIDIDGILKQIGGDE